MLGLADHTNEAEDLDALCVRKLIHTEHYAYPHCCVHENVQVVLVILYHLLVYLIPASPASAGNTEKEAMNSLEKVLATHQRVKDACLETR